MSVITAIENFRNYLLIHQRLTNENISWNDHHIMIKPLEKIRPVMQKRRKDRVKNSDTITPDHIRRDKSAAINHLQTTKFTAKEKKEKKKRSFLHEFI